MNVEIEIHRLVKELSGFQYTLSCIDKVWNIIFPDQAGKWHQLHINRYKDEYYIRHVNGDGETLVVRLGKPVEIIIGFTSHTSLLRDSMEIRIWQQLLPSVHRWLRLVRSDWVKANRIVCREYPLSNRTGVVPHAMVRETVPDLYRLDRDVGIRRTWKFVRLVEAGFFLKREQADVPAFTSRQYFEYCRIAYLAARTKDDKINTKSSGRDLYLKYADGRHDGLLDIDPDSEREFSDWIDGKHPKRRMGGHPWEIKRGGNTTHIDLSVFRPHLPGGEGFKIELRGEAISRLAETIKMFLALHLSGRPISIANPEGVRKRLLALDTIGIIPSYDGLHRANQCFESGADVFDVMHYQDLGRTKRRVLPFIIWKPLPILRPKLNPIT